MREVDRIRLRIAEVEAKARGRAEYRGELLRLREELRAALKLELHRQPVTRDEKL